MEKTVERISKQMGKRLELARLIRRMHQSQLARELGVVQKTISYWESGKSPIPSPHLVNLCKVLNVPMDWFVLPIEQVPFSEIFPELDELFDDAPFTPIAPPSNTLSLTPA